MAAEKEMGGRENLLKSLGCGKLCIGRTHRVHTTMFREGESEECLKLRGK